MMLHGAPSPTLTMEGIDATKRPRRKRKAESQDNERLSKRLSLLNLEKNGQKLYVPVENPAVRPQAQEPTAQRSRNPSENGTMELDDSKYKVYVYNLDDELSSSESEPDDGKLVLLPDIQKHMHLNRIPPVVLANSDGELAGMQVVLYNVPTSLTVPEERDSVRKAIIEARARVREKQRQELEGIPEEPEMTDVDPPLIDPNFASNSAAYDPDSMDID